MRHRADELPVLQDRAAAHALHDPARAGAELRIGHAEHDVLAVAVAVNAADARGELPCLPAVHGGEDGGRAGADLARLHQPAVGFMWP